MTKNQHNSIPVNQNNVIYNIGRKSIVDQVKEHGMTFGDFLVKARYLAEIEHERQKMENARQNKLRD